MWQTQGDTVILIALIGSAVLSAVILLPIMIYHPLQLIVCYVMAEAYANRHRQQLSNEVIEDAQAA